MEDWVIFVMWATFVIFALTTTRALLKLNKRIAELQDRGNRMPNFKIEMVPMNLPIPFGSPIPIKHKASKRKCAFGPCNSPPVFAIVDKSGKDVEYVCEKHTGLTKMLSHAFGELELRVIE